MARMGVMCAYPSQTAEEFKHALWICGGAASDKYAAIGGERSQFSKDVLMGDLLTELSGRDANNDRTREARHAL